MRSIRRMNAELLMTLGHSLYLRCPISSRPKAMHSTELTERRSASYPVFFFQAEDGIRGLTVTGVQTCALPILMMFAPLIRALPGRVSRLALIPTDQIPMMDDHHFDMTGQKLWADRGVQILIDRGWEIGRASCRVRA